MNKERFRNYGLWAAILALVPMVLELFGVNLVPEKYKEVSMALLSILVMAGILNNPNTECKWFLDDSCKVTPVKEPEKLEQPAEETEKETKDKVKDEAEQPKE